MLNKRLIIAFALLILCAVLSASSSYVVYSASSEKFAVPMAPINGRKREVNFYSLLNNSGREYESWLKDGKKYLARKEYEQAIWAFRKAVKLEGANEEARFFLGYTYDKRAQEGLVGDLTNWNELAIREYLAAIELADHLPARYNLAIIYRRLGRFAEARRHLEHILIIQPKGALAKKADKELKALFAQDVRPSHISLRIYDEN